MKRNKKVVSLSEKETKNSQAHFIYVAFSSLSMIAVKLKLHEWNWWVKLEFAETVQNSYRKQGLNHEEM